MASTNYSGETAYLTGYPKQAFGPVIPSQFAFTGKNVFYKMRAYNTSLAHDVYWDRLGQGDPTGAFSGYPIANLQDIGVAFVYVR